jgi:hypothetical protein
MNPDQSFPAPPNTDSDPQPAHHPHNPYEFIMNPAQMPKKAKGGIGNDSFILKIVVIIVGAGFVLGLLGFILNSVLGSKTNSSELVALAQTQTEITRVALFGATAQDQGVRNAAITAQYALTTQEQALATFLAPYRVKLGAAQLKLKKNPATDQRLAAAQAASTFDVAFTQTMVGELQAYAVTLKTAYTHATNNKERVLLAADYNDVQLMLKQWPTNPT